MPRLSRVSKGENRHNPLHIQITEDKFAETKKTGKTPSSDGEDETLSGPIDPRTSSKILSLARKQQDEEEGSPTLSRDSQKASYQRGPHASLLKSRSKGRHANEEDEDEDFYAEEGDFDADQVYDELVGIS